MIKFRDKLSVEVHYFGLKTLPGIAQVTTEDLDEMRSFFFRTTNCLTHVIDMITHVIRPVTRQSVWTILT